MRALLGTLLCAATVIAAAPAHAGKVSIRSDVSTTRVAPNEPFTMTVQLIIDGTSEDPQYTPPELDGLEILRKSTQRGQSFVVAFG